MYDKEGNLLDRRELLRIKLKSLAEEARIIRIEERRARGTSLAASMHQHRTGDVRRAARHTHIAYGLIKGRTLEQIEPTCKVNPDWDSIDAMIRKYGPKTRPVYSKESRVPVKAAAPEQEAEAA